MSDTKPARAAPPPDVDPANTWSSTVLYSAAKMYYEDEATQAEIAARMGISRATVSRLLSEARRQGIVKITVVEPAHDADEELRQTLERTLGLRRAYLSGPPRPGGPTTEEQLGTLLGPAVGRALQDAEVSHGDVILVSSGRTLYEVARTRLPQIPGVVVAPTIGGIDQPEDWFQTNEITRLLASALGGRALYLFAPAMPGPSLHKTLRRDPTIQRVLHLWPQAKVVLTGIGGTPLLRTQVPQYVPSDANALWESVGDVCGRLYDRNGDPVSFPGSDRLIAIELADLRTIPTVVAVAAGSDKVQPTIVGARAGYFNQLVTDPRTAEEIIARS